MIVTLLNNPSLSDYYVQPLEKQKALKELNARIISGEEPIQILKIKDDYYRNKVIIGLVPMSAMVYARIMRELPLLKPEVDSMHCIRCGAVCNNNSIYCAACSDKYKPVKKADVSTFCLPYIRHKPSKKLYYKEDV